VHEYALVQNVIKEIVSNLAARGITAPGKVKELSLKVGRLEMHSSEAFAQAFEMLSKGTPLEGAKINLGILPLEINCTACGFKGEYASPELDVHNPPPVVECPKCKQPTAIQGGRGVRDLEMIVVDD
jgi:hydrogenase nickel incorporation protein HypA/HybF